MSLFMMQRGYLLRGVLSDGSFVCVCQSKRDDPLLSTTWNSWKGKESRQSFTRWRLSKLTNPGEPVTLGVNRRYCSSRNNNSSGERKEATLDLTGSQIKELKRVKSDSTSGSVFYDSLRIFVKGGTGGHGLPSKGGIGGKGGDVVAVGHKNASLKKVALINASRRFSAEPGTDSKFFCLNGIPGKNKIIPVPVGVSIITEQGHKIGEVNQHGERIIVAKGGAGGNSSNGFSAQPGQSHNIKLDLKLIADVGFVGFPNAGKSTLLKGISRASPKIASYPFTTIRPNIGVIEYPDLRQISLADLPGLIEGAHVNIGMGHKFLKHVERTKVLLFIVDIHGFQLGPNYPFRSALETIVLLNKELELYKEELTEKPAILVLNKSDLPGSYRIIKDIESVISDQSSYETYLKSLSTDIVPENVVMFDKIIPISAKSDPISVNELKKVIRSVIDVNADYERVSSVTVV